MNIVPENKKLLLEDMDYSIRMMRQSEPIELKLFYLSSICGALSRIFNVHFDSQLVFIHLVLTDAYNNIMLRQNSIKGGELTVQFPEPYFEKLTAAVEGSEEQDSWQPGYI